MSHTRHLRRSKRNLDASRTVIVGVCVLAVSLIALSRDGKDDGPWMTVEGNIQDTRIVPSHSFETKWGARVIWVAEYKVVYLAAEHEYSVWTNSAVRGENKLDVQLRLPQPHPKCSVRYSLKEPASAVASCP